MARVASEECEAVESGSGVKGCHFCPDKQSNEEQSKVKSEATVTETISCPSGGILDAWSDSDWNDGVQIDQIQELTTLAVRTTNSLYEITVLNGRTGEVLVRGGEFFPVRTPVRLEGSTCGGSILKKRGIYVGLRMEIVPQPVELVSRVEHDAATGQREILLGHKVITTSSIQSIGIVL
ncbi:MAG: hypothetical protein DMG30_29700 [Acidobacteria bacterium]|nr:MAG: hypothetical protein DMG30_29700 [Acidobacteriota bacterium]